MCCCLCFWLVHLKALLQWWSIHRTPIDHSKSCDSTSRYSATDCPFLSCAPWLLVQCTVHKRVLRIQSCIIISLLFFNVHVLSVIIQLLSYWSIMWTFKFVMFTEDGQVYGCYRWVFCFTENIYIYIYMFQVKRVLCCFRSWTPCGSHLGVGCWKYVQSIASGCASGVYRFFHSYGVLLTILFGVLFGAIGQGPWVGAFWWSQRWCLWAGIFM